MKKLEDILEIDSIFNIAGRGRIVAGHLREDFDRLGEGRAEKPLVGLVVEFEGQAQRIIGVECFACYNALAVGKNVGIMLRPVAKGKTMMSDGRVTQLVLDKRRCLTLEAALELYIQHRKEQNQLYELDGQRRGNPFDDKYYDSFDLLLEVRMWGDRL